MMINYSKSITLTFMALASALTAQAQITLLADADTYTRAGVNAGSDDNINILNQTGADDFVGYFRFDLSAYAGMAITDATLTLHETGGSRNDSIVTGRFQNFGLTNEVGNTSQNWDESTLGEGTGLGLEYLGVSGVDTARLFNLDADLGANVIENVPGTDNVDVTLSGTDLVTFINQRLADGGLVTFINVITSENRGYGFASRENADTTIVPELSVTVVPEPSTYAAILGALALLLVGIRRKFL